jgi:NADH-quinone oxidoreductase subunit G
VKKQDKMINIFIDEKSLEVEEGLTIFRAAEQAGIPIPHLCYHPAFIPEGSCRMCLVEIEGLPKLELACSTNVKEGMKISTQSDKVKDARKGVLEFLLAEHPIDCPICDKAGDCKLQDYYEEYGLFDSQFHENKERKRKLVHIGKSLLLDQERCILCSRCVRFLKEITRTDELGIFNRGIHSEVDIYDGSQVDNNYSGNLAELCPVGAITDRDFRFKTRSWFLNKDESLCPLCSRGCNIFIEHHEGFSRFPLPKRVYRIRARKNPDINGPWICDLGRYGYSFIDERRIDQIHTNRDSKISSWEEAISFIADKIKRLYHMRKTSRIALILNSWLTNEELFLYDRIFRQALGVKKIFFADPPDNESDGFLMTNERSPNRRGALEVGFGLPSVTGEALANGVELLLIFGPYLSDHPFPSEMRSALEAIEMTILFTHRTDELNSMVDVVLPLSLIPEKEGSLTNVDGIVQKFSPALESPGAFRSEWWFLVELAKKIKIDFKYYSRFYSPEAIFAEMSRDISFFEKKSE